MAIVPYSDGFVMGFERKGLCTEDAGRPTTPDGAVWPEAPRREDSFDRDWPFRDEAQNATAAPEAEVAEGTGMHQRVALQHRWLCAVLGGHYGNYGVTSNFRCLNSFYYEVKRLWFRSLGKRDQRGLTWDCFQELFQVFPLPSPGSLTVARRDFVATYSFESSRMHEGALTEQ